MAKQITTISRDLFIAVARYVKEDSRRTRQSLSFGDERIKSTDGCYGRIISFVRSADGSVVKHAWKEVTWDIATNEWLDEGDGYSGTAVDQYITVVPDKSEELIVDLVYYITKQFDAESGIDIWTTQYTRLPVPQYPLMVYSGGQNTWVMDYVRAHPMF